MIIKIVGELDSVDRAELAARSIRDKIDGVSRINIIEKNSNNNQSYFSVGAPYNGNQTSLYYMNVYDPSYNSVVNSSPEIETGIEANLEIDCNESSATRVIAQIHAHGGVKVRKLYGKQD